MRGEGRKRFIVFAFERAPRGRTKRGKRIKARFPPFLFSASFLRLPRPIGHK